MLDLTSKKNPIAKTLSDPKFKPKTVKAKKGKGSYSRTADQLADYRMRAHSQIEQGISLENTDLDGSMLD